MAATTMATMAVLNTKCLNLNTTPKTTPKAPKLTTLPKGLSVSNPNPNPTPCSLTAPAIAGAIFSTLSVSEAAMAAQQIAQLAEGDNRGTALLLPIIPALAWVLYNILQPALNQLNRMRETKGVVIGVGLGGLAATGLLLGMPEAASANEIGVIGEAVSDNRGQLLLFVVAPAILWVLYNILQPALNQINRMRS